MLGFVNTHRYDRLRPVHKGVISMWSHQLFRSDEVRKSEQPAEMSLKKLLPPYIIRHPGDLPKQDLCHGGLMSSPPCWGLVCDSWQHPGSSASKELSPKEVDLPFLLPSCNLARSPEDCCCWSLSVSWRRTRDEMTDVYRATTGWLTSLSYLVALEICMPVW